MRLSAPNLAPEMELTDIHGRIVNVGANGRRTLLCFFRDPACPFCNFRIYELTAHQGALAKLGLDIVAVFAATPEEVYRHPATPFVYGFLGSVNFFHGRVEGEGLRVGDDHLQHGVSGLGQGAEVVAFARPHELDIVVDGGAGEGVAARVSRILAFGVTARVELDGINGATGQHFEVELTRDRVAQLALHEGQAVRLLPSRLSLFEQPHAARAAGAAR